jgi:polysaccharide biosynthesis/export protein
MKKIIIASLLILPFMIESQNIDQDFLDTLPESVRDDVKESMKAKKALEEPVYRRASTKIDKPNITSTKKSEVSNQVFGANFFDTMQSSFMPINEPNLDSSYILDFGDVLEIQLIGQKDSIESHTIKRDGSINIPDIGKVILSGLPLEEASALIKAKITNTYIGTDAYITLKNIRDITILIAGNAYNPGIYTLNGNSNILHALNMAGGISESGSFRNISLVRDGVEIGNFDLYEAIIFGKINLNLSLRSGDSVVVGPLSRIVSVESGVNRPGIYEMRKSEKLSHLIRFSNGLSSNADISDITIKSIFEGDPVFKSIKYADIDEYELLDQDSLYVREYVMNTISIQGAVKNPGNYKVKMGTTLSKAIQFAGGYIDGAYPFGGYLDNRRALLINQESKDRLYDSFINNIVMNSSVKTDVDGSFGIILEQIKNAESTGRIIAEFDTDVLRSNPQLDTILDNGDRLTIPYITQQVYIQGEVSNPGAVRYSPGKDLEFYIKKSGGELSTADLDNIFILNPNGETQIIESSRRLSFVMAESQRTLIYPGSIIYVPQSSDFTSSLEVASIWAPIISSVALSLTSLSVLNNTN